MNADFALAIAGFLNEAGIRATWMTGNHTDPTSEQNIRIIIMDGPSACDLRPMTLKINNGELKAEGICFFGQTKLLSLDLGDPNSLDKLLGWCKAVIGTGDA